VSIRWSPEKLAPGQASAGELRIEGDPANPTVSMELEGVDTDGLIEAARVFDTPGNRQFRLPRCFSSRSASRIPRICSSITVFGGVAADVRAKCCSPTFVRYRTNRCVREMTGS
jgi:hypothetical protein